MNPLGFFYSVENNGEKEKKTLQMGKEAMATTGTFYSSSLTKGCDFG